MDSGNVKWWMGEPVTDGRDHLILCLDHQGFTKGLLLWWREGEQGYTQDLRDSFESAKLTTGEFNEP